MRENMWNAALVAGKRECCVLGILFMLLIGGTFPANKTFGQSDSPPVDPADLAVASDGGNALLLIWDDNSDNEDNFAVERKIGTQGTFSTIATLPANTTKWRDENTANGYNTAYIYRIKAVNNTGASESTLEAGAVTELSPTTSCATVNDRTVDSPPAATPPGLPLKFGRFRDDLSGLEVIRLTDKSDGDWNFPAYSYWKSFNSNNTRIFIINSSGGGGFYRLNPDTFRIIGERVNLPKNANFRVEGMHWSNTNPDIMYAFRGARPTDANSLHEYNVQNETGGGANQFIRQFSPGERRGGWLDQMTVSEDNDNVFAWTLRNACPGNNQTDCLDNQKGSYYFTWTRGSSPSDPGTIERGLFIPNSATQAYNEVHVSKTGSYLLRAFTGPESRDLLPLGTPTPTTITYLSHFDLGRDFLVGSDNTGNGEPPSRPRIRRVNFNAPGANTLLFNYKDWRQESYFSLLADDEDWVLVSQSQVDPVPSTDVENMYQEIFLLSTSGIFTNGNPSVKRLAHHYSVNWKDNQVCKTESVNPDPDIVSRNCYRARVHANISRDGKFVAFTSTWGVFNGRKDAFILRTECPIPPTAIYNVGGRVTTASGAGLGNARLTLEDSKGNTRLRQTTADGYYTFPGIPAGNTTVTVSRGNTEFANPTQSFSLIANRDDINFSALP